MSEKQTIAFFAWSQKIEDESLKQKVEDEVEAFLIENKDKIKKIIYWWWVEWVMWIVLEACRKVWIEIKWYSIERYREYDEWNWVDITFFQDDDERIRNFAKNWDLFIALPGAFWTVKEIIWVKDHILEWATQKYIFVSSLFTAFYNLVNELTKTWMVYWKDKKTIIPVENLWTIRI